MNIDNTTVIENDDILNVDNEMVLIIENPSITIQHKKSKTNEISNMS